MSYLLQRVLGGGVQAKPSSSYGSVMATSLGVVLPHWKHHSIDPFLRASKVQTWTLWSDVGGTNGIIFFPRGFILDAARVLVPHIIVMASWVMVDALSPYPVDALLPYLVDATGYCSWRTCCCLFVLVG